MNLANLIRVGRESEGMSRSALARQIGIASNWLGLIENEGKIPSDDVMDKLTDIFDDSSRRMHVAAVMERGHIRIRASRESEAKLLVNLRASLPEMSDHRITKVTRTLKQ
jgi:transcriptional regulator with XRE-family HTH domain